jgi:hypothetical protein
MPGKKKLLAPTLTPPMTCNPIWPLAKNSACLYTSVQYIERRFNRPAPGEPPERSFIENLAVIMEAVSR